MTVPAVSAAGAMQLQLGKDLKNPKYVFKNRLISRP